VHVLEFITVKYQTLKGIKRHNRIPGEKILRSILDQGILVLSKSDTIPYHLDGFYSVATRIFAEIYILATTRRHP
jgi:hypothetical protein